MHSATAAVVIDFQAFRSARAAAQALTEPVAEQRVFDWAQPADRVSAKGDRHAWDVLGPADTLVREVRQAPHRARMLQHLTATALCSGHVPSE
jgi:hypothetical protein